MPRYGNIKLLALDMDGVLTDGGIILNEDGTESKKFSVQDGHGIKMWQRAGLKTAIISGRSTKVTQLRADQLGIEHLYQDAKKKLPVYEQLLKETGIDTRDTAYVGDDLLDLPLVRRAGFGVAVANAVGELKENADYITQKPGGAGAVREVIEYLLKESGQWLPLMERYLV